MTWLKLIVIALVFAPYLAQAESEKCDPFTIAVKNGPPPMTVLRSGISPVLSISGQLFHYDPVAQCLRGSNGPQTGECMKRQTVMAGGKAVAVIEGKSKMTIMPVDAHGNPNRAGLYYQMMVEHDAYRTAQPRFWLEAVEPRGATPGAPRVVGRLDAVEGLTVDQMTANKAPLASGRKLINMNGASLMYANCRKLTVAKFNERFYPAPTGRQPAEAASHLQQPPRPSMLAQASRKK